MMPRLRSVDVASVLWVFSTALLLAATSGCTREERTLAVQGSLIATRAGHDTQILEVGSRLPDAQLSAQAFEDAWNAALHGNDIGTGVALSMGGQGQEVAGKTPLIGLMIVLPTPFDRGDVIPVSGTFRAPTTMPLYWTTFGPHPLAAQGTASVALRLFDYRAIGLITERDFLATSATGSIEIVSMSGDQVELEIDITARNDLGETVQLIGPITVRGEKYRPPYFS
jgi:hypothetical protein